MIEGKINIQINNENNTTEERDDTMTATKPVLKPGALVLQSNKVSEFFEKKTNTSSDALKRFEKRKPKDGIVTPFKR